MNYIEFINRSQNLYEKIFNEKIVDSIEYTIFAQGNPHPLRIKVEDELAKVNEDITWLDKFAVEQTPPLMKQIIKRNLLKELDRLVMEFIEDHTN
jgi:hypothetical protein